MLGFYISFYFWVAFAAFQPVHLLAAEASPNPEASGQSDRCSGKTFSHPLDGSEALYAHLDPESTQLLKVGQGVKAGEAIGKSDTSGGVTGPHLHFEYSPSGNIYDKKTKVDPVPCMFVSSTFSLDTYWEDGEGIFQVFIGDQLLGENPPGKTGRFAVTLKPGKYPFRVIAKQIKNYRAVYFSISLGKRLTILDANGTEVGPGLSREVEEGMTVESTLLVQ
jgi:hypothetical protein